MRLDNKLVSEGLVLSRSQGLDLIKRGFVFVNDRCVTKPAYDVLDHDQIDIKKEVIYVSRGADKLVGFLKKVPLTLQGMHAYDIGASTGGFTQVLLLHGVQSVETFDVGFDQLDKSLRHDPNVIVHEQTNVLNYPLQHKDLSVVDVSFTSVLPILAYLKPYSTYVIALIKPQFEQVEAFKDIIKHPLDIQRIMKRVTQSILDLGFHIERLEPSELKGKKGNQEFFVYLTQ